MERGIEEASEALRAFMFERVYFSGSARGEEEKAERMLGAMYSYFTMNISAMPSFYVRLAENCSEEQAVSDYLSSMTDRYAVYTFNKIFVPKGWTFIDEGN